MTDYLLVYNLVCSILLPKALLQVPSPMEVGGVAARNRTFSEVATNLVEITPSLEVFQQALMTRYLDQLSDSRALNIGYLGFLPGYPG